MFPPKQFLDTGSLSNSMKLDNKDHKVIDLLKKNSREPIRELAKKTKIRPSTIHQRIQKLVSRGVIEKFTIKLNNAAIEENLIVFMMIKGGTTDYIDNKILNDRHVKEVFGVTGEYDMMIKLKFKDVGDFNNFVINFRRGRKDIQSTSTMVVTANLKEEI